MKRSEAIEIPFGAKDSELKGWEYTIPEGMKARIEGNKVILEPKESEDEKIRNAIIAVIHLYYGEPLEDEAKEMIAWLEKQGEHIKFLRSIQIGDEITRNPDGVLVNLSQLKRMAEQGSQNLANSAKTCKEEHNPAWSEEDEHRITDTIYFLDTIKKHYASTEELCSCIEWLKSLKERYTWKPSDEQMIALKESCDEH